jgi:iron complex transport system ATP-binding protein
MITAENISYKYPENGGFKLKNVSIKLEHGSFAALTGPNGAGKTTLIKILAGLINGYGGKVMLGNKDIRQYSAKDFARQVSYIPQAESYVFDFTVYDIVAMGRRPYINEAGVLKNTDREAIDAALYAFELYEKRGRKFGSLSGGEKRMALIGRAMAQEAGILLMDEPTTFLDLLHGSALMEKLLMLNKEGKTVLMISHDINLAAEYIDRIILIKEGEVVFDGPSQEALDEDRIRRIYGVENFVVQKNSMTGRKNVFLVPGKISQKSKVER